MSSARDVREAVRDKYSQIARRVADGREGSCCGPSCGGDCADPVTADLYETGEVAGLPADALTASLGCGNPTALAALRPEEVVLDLGSGAGLDVLLSARRVGPGGKAYGIDMTDEMLALARRNQQRAGIANAEFLKGHLEDIPLPNASVDVVISNCVINLAANKRRVLIEAFRVLRPGGRFAVSDIVVRGVLPDAVRRSLELWAGCVAGALEEAELLSLLGEVGFEAVEIEPTRIYSMADAASMLGAAGLDAADAAKLEGRLMAAFVRARKPVSEPSPTS